MKVLAIIPARGGSKGIPRKNLQPFGGRPLVAHTIDQALRCDRIDTVLVSTEDAEIEAVARKYGANVHGRIEEFIHDNSVQEVDRLLRWTVLQLEEQGQHHDVIVLLYPTAPLREIATISQAVDMVVNEGYDSVLSLFEDTTYLWTREGDTVRPTNYKPETRGPRQKEEWNQWGENKAVYAMTRDLLVNTGCRLGGKAGAVEMPKWRSIDVDAPDDLELCRTLYEQRIAGKTE